MSEKKKKKTTQNVVPLSSSRASDPFLFLKDLRLLINLPKNELSQNLDELRS